MGLHTIDLFVSTCKTESSRQTQGLLELGIAYNTVEAPTCTAFTVYNTYDSANTLSCPHLFTWQEEELLVMAALQDIFKDFPKQKTKVSE